MCCTTLGWRDARVYQRGSATCNRRNLFVCGPRNDAGCRDNGQTCPFYIPFHTDDNNNFFLTGRKNGFTERQRWSQTGDKGHLCTPLYNFDARHMFTSRAFQVGNLNTAISSFSWQRGIKKNMRTQKWLLAGNFCARRVLHKNPF